MNKVLKILSHSPLDPPRARAAEIKIAARVTVIPASIIAKELGYRLK